MVTRFLNCLLPKAGNFEARYSSSSFYPEHLLATSLSSTTTPSMGTDQADLSPHSLPPKMEDFLLYTSNQ
jgi:hypothetical protein